MPSNFARFHPTPGLSRGTTNPTPFHPVSAHDHISGWLVGDLCLQNLCLTRPGINAGWMMKDVEGVPRHPIPRASIEPLHTTVHHHNELRLRNSTAFPDSLLSLSRSGIWWNRSPLRMIQQSTSWRFVVPTYLTETGTELMALQRPRPAMPTNNPLTHAGGEC